MYVSLLDDNLQVLERVVQRANKSGASSANISDLGVSTGTKLTNTQKAHGTVCHAGFQIMCSNARS